jgi:hypothetical protein
MVEARMRRGERVRASTFFTGEKENRGTGKLKRGEVDEG